MTRNKLHSATALKLHAFGVGKLHDPNWTGCELYDEVKQHTRGRRDPTELLRRPLANGLAYHMGCWLFQQYLLDEYRFENTVDEYALWFLEDYVQFLRFHNVRLKKRLDQLEAAISRAGELYDRDEQTFYEFLDSEPGRRSLAEPYGEVLDAARHGIEKLESVYAADYADRVLHDRQLCAHIAQILIVIGFDGDDVDSGTPKQWCRRVKPPLWVRDILLARDRGKCSACGRDLSEELRARPHIDHIVPLSAGGCNDVINLQILCDRCNLRKSARSMAVLSSVPPYFSGRLARPAKGRHAD